MSDGSDIEWCDATWTIAMGCTRVDHRCEHCYAIPFAHRGLHETHRGLTKLRPKGAARPGVDWNGTVRTLPQNLGLPLSWRKSRRVFVGSMTDLFHPAIPFDYIAAVFGVMASTPRHTYMVLTKRPKRAREFFAWMAEGPRGRLADAMIPLDAVSLTAMADVCATPWPLPNVHLGVSVSDQTTWDADVPELLQCPAALHWVSAEPLLGPIDIIHGVDALARKADFYREPDEPQVAETWGRVLTTARVSWIVAGGESGAGARECHVQWLREIVSEAHASGCAVFVKQLGAQPRRPASEIEPGGLGSWSVRLADKKGGKTEEWSAAGLGELAVRELQR